jgi:hypothetical protein
LLFRVEVRCGVLLRCEYVEMEVESKMVVFRV